MSASFSFYRTPEQQARIKQAHRPDLQEQLADLFGVPLPVPENEEETEDGRADGEDGDA